MDQTWSKNGDLSLQRLPKGDEERWPDCNEPRRRARNRWRARSWARITPTIKTRFTF